ncbi:alpha/beta hydrolase [Sphingomonas mollis]|uniref:Alpha/beta hydrolase n=1 Tax=Sphingomonas mollis TaxID=2795726 RepID=A0ABS0XNK8_9SPHN|nr:alpha/beta hydrolase [Sphingomonas sp. BT553]MBJ6121630.1 alpha/beta hydrolase [Sphingomonas sp. BT553]
MKRALLALGIALASVSTMSVAQMPKFTMTRMPTPAQTDAIPLYPTGTLPAGATPEIWDRVTATMPDGTRMDSPMARNVSIPTITPVLPDPGKATGAAVVVAPGGAFLSLSMESEGFQIARWLADHGIAAFVLKYRLNTTPADEAAFQQVIGQRMGEAIRQGGAVAGIGEPRAYQDALQALKLVRAGGAKWRVDPARVGIIGFSAGAMTALQSVLTGEGAARPAFVGYIYGPMAAVPVPAGAPPMFAALALDDPLFGRQGFGIIEAWQKAGVPVELHAYERGDHGFGIGRPGTTTTLLMDEFHLWLASRGLLGTAK